MTGLKKLCIRPLDEKSDYSLWRLWLKATFGAKSVSNVSKTDTGYAVEASFDSKQSKQWIMATEEQKEQSSNIIMSAFDDHALRDVRSVFCQPQEVLKKRNASYDSRTMVKRIFKMDELVYVTYRNLRDDI